MNGYGQVGLHVIFPKGNWLSSHTLATWLESIRIEFLLSTYNKFCNKRKLQRSLREIAYTQITSKHVFLTSYRRKKFNRWMNPLHTQKNLSKKLKPPFDVLNLIPLTMAMLNELNTNSTDWNLLLQAHNQCTMISACNQIWNSISVLKDHQAYHYWTDGNVQRCENSLIL